MFNRRLDDFLYKTHEIIKLAHYVDWNMFDRHYDSLYHPDHGAPALPTRRMVSLLLLKYMFDLSDEELVVRWIENPYWQYFSGEAYLQSRKPCVLHRNFRDGGNVSAKRNSN